MKWILPGLLALMVVPSVCLAEAPVFAVVPDGSSVTFQVKKASVPIQGRFDKWKSTLTFTSPAVSTGVFDIKVDADSVDTGSGIKNDKLKSPEFFDVKNNPVISFRSKSISQTGPNTFSMDGDFMIRGVSKPQTVVLTTTRGASGGEIKGTMTFDRKDYGMNGGSGIPFVTIGDHVNVAIDMKVKRVSGPPVTAKP
jgi:polyisoprenoid-binding protein YceI